MKKNTIIKIVIALVVAGGAFVGGMSLYNAQLFTGEGKEVVIVDEKGNSTVAKVTFEKGKPVSVNIDVQLKDGTWKSEASASGEYDMKNDGLKWHEQVDLFEQAIADNGFDLDTFAADAVSGVTIGTETYIQAVKDAMVAPN